MSAVVTDEDLLVSHCVARSLGHCAAKTTDRDKAYHSQLCRIFAETGADARGRGEAKGWEAAMRMEHPWSLLDVLRVLCLAVDHLLGQHGCDDHGHEETKAARDAGREILEAIARRGGAR